MSDTDNPVKSPPPVATARIERSLISGPLPPPAALAEYGGIDPSFPERIVKMAEKEQESTHRLQQTAFDMERQRVQVQAASLRRGQLLGSVVALSFMAASLWLGLAGKEIAASVLGGSTLFSIIAVIVTGNVLHQKT